MKKILIFLFVLISVQSFSQGKGKWKNEPYIFLDTLHFQNVPYNSGAGIVHIGIDTVTGSPTYGKLVRKTAGTPTLQQVTTAGNTTTNALQSDNDVGFDVVSTIVGGSVRAEIGKFSDNGFLTLGNTTTYTGTIKPDILSGFHSYLLPETGHATDTIATLFDVGKYHARSTAQTSANTNILGYAVGASDGTFQISANVLVTASATHSFTVTVDYTDEGNTARTITLTFSQLAGTFITAITNVTGAAPYEGVPLTIRAKASTNIVFKTAGTFTSVTYNVDANITQLN